jgi:gliding motility-associated-like protein
MNKTYIIISLLLLTSISLKVFAQVPQIQKVEAQSTYPLNKIIISGSGFSATPANLQVWFDQVKGNITASTEYSIEVDVPAQAKLSNVEVINLTSKLSAKSNVKFMPSFSGEPFDPLKFEAPIAFPSIDELLDLCSCDLNNDGKPDIISTKDKSPATDLMILQNSSAAPGNLSFTKLDKLSLPVLNLSVPADNVVCGDLQGDGKPDLVVTQSGSPRNNIYVLTNTSAGSISFDAPLKLTIDVDHSASRVAIKDLNGDGKPDIVVTDTYNDLSDLKRFIYIFQNQSAGGVLSINATPIKIDITSVITNTYSVDVQDLDGDALPDIIVNQYQTKDIFILKNKSAGAINFPLVQKIAVGTTSTSLNRLISADVNNDGLLDLINTDISTKQVVILLNKSTSSSFSFPSSLQLSTSGQPFGADVSDFDGDGDPDIIVAIRDQKIINVFLHNGNYANPSFPKKDVATTKPAVLNVLAGDLDGDGKPDLAYTSRDVAASTYSLEILRNKNCHQPKILNELPLVICSGQTIRLNAIPAVNVTFSWKNGATPVAGTSSYLDVTSAGSYTITATGESGACGMTSTAVSITSDPATFPSDPAITAPATVCSGTNLQLKTAFVSGATYTWTGPNNFTSAQQNPFNNAVDFGDAGIYSLQVTVGVCKSNIKTAKVDVVDMAGLTIASTVPSNTICQGNSLTLSVSPSFNYQWIKDGDDIIGQTNNTLNVTTTGSYQVKVDNGTCNKTTAAVAVTVVTIPDVSFTISPATTCKGGLITFTNTSINVNTSANPVYKWVFDGVSTSTLENPTFTYNTVNTFTPSLTVSYTGVTGCSDIASKPLTIKPSTPPVIVADKESICPEESTNLSIGNTYTSVNWSNGGSGSSTSIDTPGNYSVTAVDGNSCPVTDDITIASNTIPVITVTADPASVATGKKSQLLAAGADTYVWTPTETLNDATIANPLASPITTTTYTVTGTMIGGCSVSNEITITVDGSIINIVVPPAFSPNGDGSNETLVVQGITDYPQCTLNIFDGRGRRIYQAVASADNWDGTYQGKPVPDGTYYYVFGCPDSKPVTGSILIFR